MFGGVGVLVTGSTSGLGEAIARRFAEGGANTVVTGRDARRGAAAAERIAAAGRGRSTFIAEDLSTLDGPLELASAAEEQLGRVDVLVNNAAICAIGKSSGFTSDELDALFTLNFRGAYLLSTALLPRMVEREAGVIVNITSAAAYRGYAGLAAFGATKAALDAVTKSWAAEFGRKGVRVNAVSPGPRRSTKSPPAEGDLEDYVSDDVVAAAVAFLAGPDARHIQGATLHVDRGMVETFGYERS